MMRNKCVKYIIRKFDTLVTKGMHKLKKWANVQDPPTIDIEMFKYLMFKMFDREPTTDELCLFITVAELNDMKMYKDANKTEVTEMTEVTQVTDAELVNATEIEA